MTTKNRNPFEVLGIRPADVIQKSREIGVPVSRVIGCMKKLGIQYAEEITAVFESMQYEIELFAESRGLKENHAMRLALDIYSGVARGDRQRTLDILNRISWFKSESETGFDEQNEGHFDRAQDILNEKPLDSIVSHW